MEKIGLVLEGGGMRGVYTCGVLEYFLDNNFNFPYCVGVSAGASNTCTYIAKQKGRGKRVNIDYLKNWRYMSLRSLIFKGSYFGMDFIFGNIPNELDVFDYEAFHRSESVFKFGATNCQTGQTDFFDKSQLRPDFKHVKASCSLPLLAPIVTIDDKPYLDGGIADPIPYKKALKDGREKLLIVLTQPEGYLKKANSDTLMKLYKNRYKHYPALIKSLKERHLNYNKALEEIKTMEQQKKAIVIRPSGKIKLSRFEKDPYVLGSLFDEGYQNASSLKEDLLKLFNG